LVALIASSLIASLVSLVSTLVTPVASLVTLTYIK
jgi:hypothetical protein